MQFLIPHQDASLDAQSSPPTEPLTEILFIDSRVEDYQSLIAYVTAGTEKTQVIILDPALAQIEQILQVLERSSDIQEVHIVSPSTEGSFQLLST